MMDRTHLSALELGLHNERARRDVTKPGSKERTLRDVYVAQREREVAGERVFLGLPAEEPVEAMSNDDLARELGL